MLIALVRHANAEDGQDEDDERRALTPRGWDCAHEIASGLSALNLTFDSIIHSPKLRAFETARALAPLAAGVLREEPLLSVSPVPNLVTGLRGRAVAIVGHEPHLSVLLSVLLLGVEECWGAFPFKIGGVALVEGRPTPRGMTLVAFTPNDVLARLSAAH